MVTWQGLADSVPVTIAVSPEPAPLPPEAAAQKAILQAQYAVALGQADQAGPVLDQFLAIQPTNILALTFKAALHEDQGAIQAALATVEGALENALTQNSGSPEAPVELLRQHRGLLQKLNAPGLSSVQQSNGPVTLQWTGWPGESYAVEVSSDLRSWTPVSTNLISTNTIQTWSTNAMSGISFYRLRW